MRSLFVLPHSISSALPDQEDDSVTVTEPGHPTFLRLITCREPNNSARGYRGHLLIVDADAAEREVLAGFLRRRGFRVWVATTAGEGLAMMAHRTPDLLLIDPTLPSQGGMQLIRSLRRQRQTARLPIIIVSAHAAAHEVRSGLALGADDFIAKPVELGLMEARINALLRRKARAHLSVVSQEWSDGFLMPSLNE